MVKKPPVPMSPERAAFRRLVLATFRLNGALVDMADALSADLDLTSGLWAVLAALSDGRRLTIAQTARRLGLRRQSVRRSARLLTERGLIGSASNPDHSRAPLLFLTEAGENAVAELDRREASWWSRVAAASVLDADELNRGLDLIERLLPRIESAPQQARRSTRLRAAPATTAGLTALEGPGTVGG
jgi:DNA-binding MarR family transcriptional regulator